jgi:gluconolactonase
MLKAIDSHNGEPLKGPNDLVLDAHGGVYFTDSGDFEQDWVTGRPAGAIYYLTPGGELLQVDSQLCFPNGIAISLDGNRLIVGEHRKNRLLQYAINPDGTLSDKQVFLELDRDCRLPESLGYELGPDGMCRDDQDNLWVAHYGGGKVLALSPEGTPLARVYLARGAKPTNTAFDADEKALYVTEGELGLLCRVDLCQPTVDWWGG